MSLQTAQAIAVLLSGAAGAVAALSGAAVAVLHAWGVFTGRIAPNGNGKNGNGHG